MKVIIVDDEPRAIDLIKGYLQHFSQMEIVASFRNGLKAFEFLSKEKVDLVFLDINMPHISGISLSKMLPADIQIIFTTAYSEFAVESYEVKALDYLLKPISLERFTQAMSRVISHSQTATVPSPTSLIYVKTKSKTHRLAPNDILYIEKDGNYSTYYLADQKIVSRESIAELLEKLPDYFIQVHKSYIVNSQHVHAVEKEFVQIQQSTIPLGPSFKPYAMQKLLGED